MEAVIDDFQQELNEQKVAEKYLTDQLELQEFQVNQLSQQKVRDKISAAEKRFTRQEVRHRYTLALREHHLNPKKNEEQGKTDEGDDEDRKSTTEALDG